MSAAAQWDALHRDPRHRLEYPSEHVVRWMASTPRELRTRVLDIGCGSGRHVAAFRDFGCAVSACDASNAAVAVAANRFHDDIFVRLATAHRSHLPYRDGEFQLALAFGVFYYGDRDDHRQAVKEMHRVLKPGGRAFVCIRTHKDWRQRFTYNGVFHCHNEPEDGMPMHFLTEYEVRTLYAPFSEVNLETTETTRKGRQRCDSDWLIQVVK